MFQTQGSCDAIAHELWLDIDHLAENKDHVMDDLYEETFCNRMRRHRETVEKLRQEMIAKKAVKNKKVKDEEEEEEEDIRTVQSKTVCLPSSSIPQKNAECFGFATSTQNAIKTETVTISDYNLENTLTSDYNLLNNLTSDSRSTNKDVSTMEADSQSQDDVVFVERIDGVASQLKIESNISFEEHETCKRDVVQTPVLRAVVRPENIEQLSLNEKESGGRNPCLEEKEREICESRSRSQETQTPEKEREEVMIQGGEDRGLESTEEPVAAEAAVVSSVDLQSSPAEALKPSNNLLLLDEFSRLSTPSDDIAQLWNDPSGGFISECFPDVDTQNWSNSHDFILGQYGDDLMAKYDTIGTNGAIAFPDFYNDQQDMVFTGAVMGSPPPLLEEADDEEEEYRLRTTHWVENISTGESDASGSIQDKSSSGLDMDITPPPVLEQESPVSVCKGRRKAKSKKPGKNVQFKDKCPTRKESVQLTEKINKVSPVKGMFYISFLIQRKLLKKIKKFIFTNKVLVTVCLTLNRTISIAKTLKEKSIKLSVISFYFKILFQSNLFMTGN